MHFLLIFVWRSKKNGYSMIFNEYQSEKIRKIFKKHSSDESLDNSEPRMIANSKSENVRRNQLVSVQPSLLQFSIPMLAAFNPFQLKHQIIGAKDVSSQLTDWLQPLRNNLFRPPSLSNTPLLSTVQANPMTANLTHLSKLMDGSGLFRKLADYEKKREEMLKNVGFVTSAPNDLIIPEKDTKDNTKGDDLSINTNNEPLDGNNVSGMTEPITIDYGTDLTMGKIPEMEKSDEITTRSAGSSRNLMEEKKLQNDPFWKHFLQINETDNGTQNSLGDLKEVVTTLNLSQAQTAAFVRIIEKIVDVELKRRRDEEASKLNFTQTSEKPKLVAAKFHEVDNESEKDIDNHYDEEIRPHEKFTPNTRLSFDEQHINVDYHNGEDGISESLVAGPMKLDSREARWKIGYIAREQAEYDRLVSGITDTTSGSDHLEIKHIQSTNQGLLRTTVESTSTEEPRTSNSMIYETIGLQPIEQPYIPKRTTIIYGKATSIPRTVFERQAEDFRSRLLGINGFGDIIKALKHAKIGFFERSIDIVPI
ncbi:unnamed protein product [Cercopithifilaria johnstoni]|uniref:Uncharacterized protein n=1 Tax=Cercopithifilaria johnstoni TaxID=2874296 RepID=A0A8J2M4M1_9BILA|nr:unnamed protein product [Cercopithifilaria johnstoni]